MTTPATYSNKLVALMKQAAALEVRSSDLYQKLSLYVSESCFIHDNTHIHSSNDININASASEYSWLTATQEDTRHLRDLESWLFELPQPVEINKQAILNHKRHQPTSFESLIKQLQYIERGAIQSYAEICQLTLEQDYKAFDLAYRNMQDNMVHLGKVSTLVKYAECTNAHKTLS